MSKEIIMGIYKITNIKNGKFYIGSSKDIQNRWNKHIYHLNRKDHINKKIQNAWNKYGADSFHFEIIDTIENVEELEELEQTYIDILTPWKQKIGYNIAKYTGVNAFRGMTHDERVRKIISETNKGRFTGEKSSTVKLTWEDVRKIRELYKIMSCSQIAKIYPVDVSGIKYIIRNKTWYDENYHPPEKTKEFLETRRMANQTWRKLPVIMLDKETNEFISEFSSVAEAKRFLNIKSGSDISKVCKGGQITAYGYKWMYKSEYQQTS